VPTALLERLEQEGVAAVRPGPSALVHAQDKLVMRERLTALGHPCPRWWRIRTADDLSAALAETDGRIVVKTPRGGYDAHGVRIVDGPDQADDWLAAHGELLAEELVPFTRELSAQVARRPGERPSPTRWCSPCRRTGSATRWSLPRPASTRRPSAGSRPSPSRSRRISASPGCSPWSCSRRPAARCWSSSSPCAPTTPGTGPWTVR